MRVTTESRPNVILIVVNDRDMGCLGNDAIQLRMRVIIYPPQLDLLTIIVTSLHEAHGEGEGHFPLAESQLSATFVKLVNSTPDRLGPTRQWRRGQCGHQIFQLKIRPPTTL